MQFSVTSPLVKKSVLNPITMMIAATSIYSMVIPIIVIDISIWFYQHVYFKVMGIPVIQRSDFVAIDRWDFSKLNIWQRISCAYCDYANGIIDYAKAVARQTELYNCAIKYSHAKKNTEHRATYLERKDFE